MVKPRNGCLLTGFTVEAIADLTRYMLNGEGALHCQALGSDGETFRMGSLVDGVNMEREGYKVIFPLSEDIKDRLSRKAG